MENFGDSVANSNVLDLDPPHPSEFENEPVSPSITEVLQNEMLLDMIVSHSIKDVCYTHHTSKVPFVGVRTLRLVNLAWLQSVSRVMAKKGRSLFHFHYLSEDNEAQRWEFKLKPSETLTASTCFLNWDEDTSALPIHQPIPPFTMEISSDKRLSLNDFFSKYGAGIVGVLVFSRDGEPLLNHDLPETVSLHKLKTLSIYPSPQCRRSAIQMEHYFLLVHSILKAAAKSLTNFKVSTNLKVQVSPNCSVSFNLPIIPTSLKHFTMSPENAKIGSAELEALLGNRLLPNLTQLDLVVLENLEDGLLHRILDNLKDSLKTLTLMNHVAYQNAARNFSRLRLPVMEKLEKLRICATCVELEPGQAPLQRLLPNVSHLELTHQTGEMLRRWMEGSKYPAVETLVVEYWTDHLIHYIPRGINLQVAGWIHTSFSNVTNLTISVVPRETSGLRTIFKQMTQLTRLHIQVRGTHVRGTDPFFMDSALIQWPSEILRMLQENLELQEGVEVEMKRGICNLANLETLTIEHMRGDRGGFGQPLSLEFTFKWALKNLLKLETVRLVNGLTSSWQVSQAVREESRGRINIID